MLEVLRCIYNSLFNEY